MKALGIGENDEVIVPAGTFIIINAVPCGATPIAVDIEKHTHNIDTNKIEDVISCKTKAIIAVHLYGQPADLDELNKIAKKLNLFLIEEKGKHTVHKSKIIDPLFDASASALPLEKSWCVRRRRCSHFK